MQPADAAHHPDAWPPSSRSAIPRLLLALVLSLAALVQLTVVSRTSVDVPLRADAGEYFSYAYNLSHHGVYSIARTWSGDSGTRPAPDAFRPPGYPLFLALVGVPEPDEAYLRRVSLVQAALGVLSVWLIYLIGRKFLGERWALAAALLTALSPHLAVISTYLLSESLFCFLLLVSVFSLLRAVESGARWLYVLTGLSWGLCSLVRSTSEFFPVLLLLGVLVLPRLRRFRLAALLAFACFAAALAPWLIRNQSPDVGKPASSLMVKALAHGSYPDFMYQGQAQSFGFPYRFDPESEAIARDLPSILRHIMGRFQAEPLIYAKWYLIGKPQYFLAWGNVQGWDILIYPVFHSPYFEDVRFVAIRMLAYLLHWPLMILGLIGALLLWFAPQRLGIDPNAVTAGRLVAMVVAYAIAFHIVVAPFPRYGIPFRPLLYALALVPPRALVLTWRHRRVAGAATRG